MGWRGRAGTPFGSSGPAAGGWWWARWHPAPPACPGSSRPWATSSATCELDGLPHPGRRLPGGGGQRHPEGLARGPRPISRAAARIRATVWVFPVPGPPAMTVTGWVSARRAATNCRSVAPSSSTLDPAEHGLQRGIDVGFATFGPVDRRTTGRSGRPTGRPPRPRRTRTAGGRAGGPSSTRGRTQCLGRRLRPVGRPVWSRSASQRVRSATPTVQAASGRRRGRRRPGRRSPGRGQPRDRGRRGRGGWPGRRGPGRAGRHPTAGAVRPGVTAATSWISKRPTIPASIHGARPRSTASVDQPVGRPAVLFMRHHRCPDRRAGRSPRRSIRGRTPR